MSEKVYDIDELFSKYFNNCEIIDDKNIEIEINKLLKSISKIIKKYGCDYNTDVAIVEIMLDIFASVCKKFDDYKYEFNILNDYLKFSKYGIPISDEEFEKLICNICDVFKKGAEIICEHKYYSSYYKILNKLEKYYKCAKEIIDDSEDQYIDDLYEIIEKMKNINLNDENCVCNIKNIFCEIGKMLPKLWI